MQILQVDFIDATIEMADTGLVTGVIFFDFGDFQFPEKDWNDSVVIILGWWLSSLVDLLSERASEVELRFMEGPFIVSVQRNTGQNFQILCREGEVIREQIKCQGAPWGILRSTLNIAVRVQRACYLRGWRSTDIDALNELVGTARKLASASS